MLGSYAALPLPARFLAEPVTALAAGWAGVCTGSAEASTAESPPPAATAPPDSTHLAVVAAADTFILSHGMVCLVRLSRRFCLVDFFSTCAISNIYQMPSTTSAKEQPATATTLDMNGGRASEMSRRIVGIREHSRDPISVFSERMQAALNNCKVAQRSHKVQVSTCHGNNTHTPPSASATTLQATLRPPSNANALPTAHCPHLLIQGCGLGVHQRQERHCCRVHQNQTH